MAVAALVVYALTLNRTTLGYEVRAVGFNPEAARYGGISVARNYFLAMAIAGLFAGLAGALDVLGWQFRLDVTQIQGSTIGFIGIAVALLGRNTAVGVGLAALLFAALETGTASRNLDPEILPAGSRFEPRDHHPGARSSSSSGADLIILLALRRLRRTRAKVGDVSTASRRAGAPSAGSASSSASPQRSSRCRRSRPHARRRQS